MNKFKALGSFLAIFAVLGAATAAHVAADIFKNATGSSATVTGTQGMTNILKTTAGSFECKKNTNSGTATSGASSVLVTPTYSECTCIGVACTIDTNGCQFRLNIGAGTTGPADVVCPGGSTITLTNTKCTLHIGSQTGLSTITYSNTGSGTTREIGLSFGINAQIKYSHTEGTGIGKCTTGSGTTGSLSGTVSVTGEIDGGSTHLGIFVE